MDQEINAGYVITDRLTIGNTEFVIGQNENAPAKFVTWNAKRAKRITTGDITAMTV